MTVVSTVDRNDYVGSGITGPYAYTFRIFAATDLAVIQADLDGVETVLAYPADYSVAGAGNRSGGSVTLTDALPDGYALSLQRAVPLTQPTSFRNQGPYFAENVEDAFDRLTMIVQQQQSLIGRSFTVPATVPIGGNEIQNFASRAYIRVNLAGDGLEGVTATVTTVQPLTPGSYLTGTAFDGSEAKTFAVDATSANTASKVVARDASGNFAANVITAALNGNATTATSATSAAQLATARAIFGYDFDGTADIGPAAPSTGSALIFDGTHWVGSHSSGVTALFDALTVSGTITGNLTGNVTGNVSGSAATVTAAAQPAITSLGTLLSVTVSGVGTFSSTTDSSSTTTGAVIIAGGVGIAKKLYVGTGLTVTAGGLVVSAGASSVQQLDATFLRGTGATVPSSGVGVEIFYSSGVGFITAFDRAAGVYEPLVIRGSTVAIATSDQSLGFYQATPVAQQVLATGASHTVDDVITKLQNLGLVKQS